MPKALPINAIDELYITANIETDTNTLCFLADNNTLVHLFTHTGTHRGNIYPNTPNAVNKSGFVLLQQLRAFDHARTQAIHRQANHKRTHQSRYQKPTKIQSRHLSFCRLLEAGVDAASSIDALMGVEVELKRGYYEVVESNRQKPKSFKFTERSKRPSGGQDKRPHQLLQYPYLQYLPIRNLQDRARP